MDRTTHEQRPSDASVVKFDEPLKISAYLGVDMASGRDESAAAIWINGKIIRQYAGPDCVAKAYAFIDGWDACAAAKAEGH